MNVLIRTILVLCFLIMPFTALGKANGNGNLQLHFMDVGQADGILLITPKGETVLWDGGTNKLCDLPVEYMDQLGVQSLEYLFTTHYHDDHFGCSKEILSRFPLEKAAYDRGTEKKVPSTNPR